MKQTTIEAKTLEEAYTKCEEELKATKDQLTFVSEKTKTGFKVVATKDVDYPMEGLEYLTSILKALNINAMVEMRKKINKEVKYVITSEENPILIGRGGKTLEAIQLLIRIVVNGDIDENEEQYKVSVDCGGYKLQRQKQLEILAVKTAKEVAKSKISANLEPMNSFERRVIHAKLSEWRDVFTESEGQGKERHIVIRPKEEKK